MKRKLLRHLMLVLALSLGLAASAWAGPWGRGCWGGTPLTPEQSAQLFNLRQRFYNDTVDLRRQLVQKQAELAALWQAPSPDQAKIAAKQKELNALRDQLQEKALQFQLEAKKIAPTAALGPCPGWGGRWGPWCHW